MRFYLLNTLGDANDDNLCVIHNSVEGIGLGDVGLHTGARIGAEYPDDAKIYMSKENPGIKLSDVLGNTNNFLMVSRGLKEVVEKHCGDKVEYLPFTLYDHRKRIYSRDYFILNPLGTFDCLDLKKSDIVWSESNPDRIVRIEEHVIDRKKAEMAPQLFRVNRHPTAYVVGVDLATEIHGRKFSNIYWRKMRFGDEVQTRA
ncbi:MAG: imm11 family protein [Hyalangium sp.]|uniref:imm11 family protein n=1 Tax=Hyalangium sp. TaxID=2028555 RepID=UPI00389B1B4B